MPYVKDTLISKVSPPRVHAVSGMGWSPTTSKWWDRWLGRHRPRTSKGRRSMQGMGGWFSDTIAIVTGAGQGYQAEQAREAGVKASTDVSAALKTQQDTGPGLLTYAAIGVGGLVLYKILSKKKASPEAAK